MHFNMVAFLSTAAAVLSLGAMACWASAVYFMFKAVANLKPGVSFWRDGYWNLLLMPSKLTDAGLEARWRCFISVCGFVLLASIVFAIAALTGQWH